MLRVTDLGRMAYRAAYDEQLRSWARVMAARERAGASALGAQRLLGEVLFVEHDPPVITISQRPGAAKHLVASEAMLHRAGVTVEATDRGGDITYHGPGQLVVYPILDLNALHLRLHDYMRLLEQVVIDVLEGFGVPAQRDPGATGVWVPGAGGAGGSQHAPSAKLCAMGIRVKQWISLHGLALNVTTDLSHFDLIVPCGLTGRPVTSLSHLLGERCPPMRDVQCAMADRLRAALLARTV